MSLHAATVTYGPLRFVQQADSPFAALETRGFTIANFEDGDLPDLVGIVWTDVGSVDAPGATGFGEVSVSAYDGDGQLIDTIGPTELGDGAVDDATDEDRFFGFRHDPGIARIAVSMPTSNDFEVEHLQYAQAVPVPSALLLFAVAVAGVALLKRR